MISCGVLHKSKHSSGADSLFLISGVKGPSGSKVQPTLIDRQPALLRAVGLGDEGSHQESHGCACDSTEAFRFLELLVV